MPERGNRIYIGNLDHAATDRDLEDVFKRFGNITDVWVARKPPGFAFVSFEDDRDAEDAVHEFNGKTIRGQRVRVEISTRKPGGGGGRGGGGGGGGGGRGYYDDRGRDAGRDGGRRSRSRERERRRSPSYERGGFRDRDRRPASRSRSPAGGRGRSPVARSPPKNENGDERRRTPSRSRS